MSAHVVQALLVGSLGWYLLTEALHSGVSAATALPLGTPGSGAAGPAPWQPLGPLVLVDEVWLVVVLALAEAGFPALDQRAWAGAAGTLLVALLLSVTQFALLLLGPVFRDARRPRRALGVLGLLVPLAWAVALGDVAGAPWWAAAAFGLVALVASLLLGAGFLGLPSSSGAARWARPAGGALVLAVLIAAGLALAPGRLLSPTGDPATLRLLGWSLVVVAPVLLALQVTAWRWALSRWLRGEPLVPIHAAGRPVPPPPVPATGPREPS